MQGSRLYWLQLVFIVKWPNLTIFYKRFEASGVIFAHGGYAPSPILELRF
jgi:hypothetical protein